MVASVARGWIGFVPYSDEGRSRIMSKSHMDVSEPRGPVRRADSSSAHSYDSERVAKDIKTLITLWSRKCLRRVGENDRSNQNKLKSCLESPNKFN